MKKLEIYLQALQAGAYKEKIITGTIEELKTCTLRELSDYRLLVGAVYCQLLRYCQSMYEGYVPENIITELLNVFESIEQIGVEATEEEKKDSNLITVWFLHELKVHREIGDLWNIEDEMLRESVQILLQELDSIYFIFDIKADKQYIFPIHDMIAKVVRAPQFIDINNPVDIYHIHILQLAARLFKSSDDKQQILRTLVNQCNLKFIDYLSTTGCIIDTLDLLNYQKNGVMIFYDSMRNKILIRHNDENYFKRQLSHGAIGMIVEEEKDYQKNKIGHFVEYNLDKGDTLTDHSEILKRMAGREAFIRLIFDGNRYNIFLEHSILEKADGSLLPVNPYCCNDTTIIKGYLKDKNGKSYDKEHFMDALHQYRSAALKVSKNCIMNRVSFGLAMLLLWKENIGVDELCLNEYTEDDWYQSQLMENWVEKSRDPIEALSFIIEQWQKGNDYCALPFKKNKKSKDKTIEDHEIEPLDFYPLKSEIGWMYQIIGCENPEEWYVLRGRVQENDEGDFILVADLVNDVVGKRFNQATGIPWLLVGIDVLEDLEGLLANIWGSGEEYYFLYNGKEQRGVIYNQNILKSLSALEKIQDKNYITLETASEISRIHYEEISAMMELHKAALEEVGKRFFCDFDSQVYYRLLHNLLWSGINKEKIGSYLKVFMHHQKLGFAEIYRDERFARKDANTLYVPKDGRESDSVLTSIFETYLKTKSTRETNDLYNNILELKDDGYYYAGNRIANIVFLCDNFECGTAAIRMLKAYLNIDVTSERADEKRKIEQVKASLQKYYLKEADTFNGEEVPLRVVVEKNACTIEVHGYYGTEIGKSAIEDFFRQQKIGLATVTYEKEIIKHVSQIIDEVKSIWSCSNPRGNVFAVVREFNMTKVNVFPEEMLADPRKAICMFVKKDEIKK